ncbi:unnamed protein product [Oikopleura dioica]|uniref:EIF-4F 25 kDa subunit n=1 Tax=Oikopleura dioica TaxID=34765 RepID=E4YW39_OIKDI|nr:unnamed protein product [Oikopleura dioica]
MSDTVTTNEVVEEVPKEQEVQKEEAKEAHVNGNDDAATNEENLHPLESAWDFWYLSADKTKEWEERMTKVMTFNTVEDFWACYHHVSLPSKLSVGSDYMIFKSGIAPKWEDSKNEDGGKWVLETDKKYRCNVDGSWLETLLGCIGEGFEEGGEYVNGAVVQIRKRVDRLQLWTAEIPEPNAAVSLGRQFKKKLNIPDGLKVKYNVHKDAITRKGSTLAARHTV